MNYSSYLFIEIIESIQGIIFLRSLTKDDITLRYYQGLSGKLVIIDTSEEDITADTGKGYLFQLGLSHLIPSLFPEPKPESEKLAAEAEIGKEENK